MAANTITRADLGEAVYEEIGLSRNDSARLVESVLAEVCDALVDGENVKISSFGSFMLRNKGEANRPQSEDRGGSADFAAARSGFPAVEPIEGAPEPAGQRLAPYRAGRDGRR